MNTKNIVIPKGFLTHQEILDHKDNINLNRVYNYLASELNKFTLSRYYLLDKEEDLEFELITEKGVFNIKDFPVTDSSIKKLLFMDRNTYFIYNLVTDRSIPFTYGDFLNEHLVNKTENLYKPIINENLISIFNTDQKIKVLLNSLSDKSFVNFDYSKQILTHIPKNEINNSLFIKILRNVNDYKESIFEYTECINFFNYYLEHLDPTVIVDFNYINHFNDLTKFTKSIYNKLDISKQDKLLDLLLIVCYCTKYEKKYLIFKSLLEQLNISKSSLINRLSNLEELDTKFNISLIEKLYDDNYKDAIIYYSTIINDNKCIFDTNIIIALQYVDENMISGIYRFYAEIVCDRLLHEIISESKGTLPIINENKIEKIFSTIVEVLDEREEFYDKNNYLYKRILQLKDSKDSYMSLLISYIIRKSKNKNIIKEFLSSI